MKWQKRTLSQEEPEVLEASGEMKSSHSPIPANSGNKSNENMLVIIFEITASWHTMPYQKKLKLVSVVGQIFPVYLIDQ